MYRIDIDDVRSIDCIYLSNSGLDVVTSFTSENAYLRFDKKRDAVGVVAMLTTLSEEYENINITKV